MIECTKFTSVSKGALVGFADLYFPKWGLEIHGCSLLMKDGKRWVNFPQKEYKNPQGETKYLSIVRFRDKAHMEAFSKAAKDAIEKHCGEMKSQTSAITDEEPPF